MKKNLTAIFFLISVLSVIIFFTFKPVLKSPNSYLFSYGGDAVKSYYNFAYHLKYGEGIKLKAINYPYGEHLQYENTHPLHLAILKPIAKVFPISNYGVAILNLSMILALLAAVPFIFLILRKYNLPVWYSFVVALIILFLSPQLDRIRGHFEMAYLFFIPMYWYLLIRFREGKNTWLWGGLLILSGLVGGFTSAYFVAFYSVFLLSVFFADVWKYRKTLKKYIKPGLTILVMAALPLLIVKGLVSATDWATDRPNNPGGFYVFHANVFSIFLPNNPNFSFLFDNLINMKYEWEGRAYVGFPATIAALSIIYISIYNLIKRKRSKLIFSNRDINGYLLAATIVLLFSMCFPFKWGFSFLLDVLPPIKQFRALGRFAWIFYYIFTVYTAWLFYNIYLKLKEKGLKKFAIIFLTVFIVSWAIDAAYNAKSSYYKMFLDNDKLEASNVNYLHMLQEANINIDDYQAIFFLPFANTSGDKLFFENGMNAFSEAMKCSYHTELPLIQAFSPRIPFSNALSSIQLLADSTIRKTRLDDMNTHPILLVNTNENLTKQEQWLKDHSEFLLSYGNVTLSKVDLKVFIESHSNWLNFTDSIQSQLKGNENIMADVPLEKIYFKNFDESIAENVFHGSGALFKRRNKVEVFNENFSTKGMIGNYELSFWMFFDTRKYDMPKPILHIFDVNKNLQETIHLNNREIHNVFQKWVRVEQNLNLEEGKIYQLEITGKYITIDDLVLKPVKSNVMVITSDQKRMINNFPFE